MNRLALTVVSAVVLVAEAQAAGAGDFVFGAEALQWRLKDSPSPVPLVTDGIVGRPETATILGGRDLGTGTHSGLRLSGAYALDARRGVEASFFHLPSRSTGAGVSSSGQLGSTELIVPYIDAVTGAESGTEISYAPIYSGSAREEASSSVQGAELNGTWAQAPAGPWQVDLLGGVRYLRLRESLAFTTSSPFIPPHPVDIWETIDRFDTTNRFLGAQAGMRARYEQDGFFATGTVKLAVGAMAQSVKIRGELLSNDFNGYGPVQAFPGGYFALPSNIGSHSRTVLAVMPEAGLNLGYRINAAVTVFAGYSLVYTNNVARPGNQVSRTVNTTQSTAYTEDPAATLAGPAQPSARFNGSGFWTGGFNAGVTVRF